MTRTNKSHQSGCFNDGVGGSHDFGGCHKGCLFPEVTFYVNNFKIIPAVFAVCPLVARWVPEYDDHQNQSDRDIQNDMVMETDNDGNDSKDNKADLFF